MISYSVIGEKSLNLSRYFAILAAIAAPASTAITGIACIAMLSTWLMSGDALKSLRRSAAQPAGKMLLVFFAWLIIGCFYAQTPWADKLTTLSSWKKLLYTFILLGIFYQSEWKVRFVNVYLTVMSVAAVIAIPYWFLKIQWVGKEAGIFMTNHSSQSLAFVVAALCCIFLFKEAQSLPKKRLLIGLLLLFLVNIFFINPSRSGYLALPVAAVFAFINLYGYKKIPHILGAMLIALALIVATSTTVQQRIKLGLEEKNQAQASKEITSIGIRVIFAQNTWELIQENPIVGYGTSSFKHVYAPHVAKKYQDWRKEAATDPHNQYLFIWLENGLIGLLIFLTYIYIAIKQGASQQTYGAIGASVLIAITTTSLFNSNFKTFPEGHLLAFFVGCLLAQTPLKKEDSYGKTK